MSEYINNPGQRKETLKRVIYLEKHGFSGPSAVMWAIHDDIRTGWDALDALLAAASGDDPAAFSAQIDEVFTPLSTAIGEMFYKEENILFPRSPAIIGRKVQKCHPPASLHRVQQILDDFRAGRRDEAEFWIQMRGQFVHIRYFAVRDEQADYQGTLEVTQDITRLRTLQGERRLLED